MFFRTYNTVSSFCHKQKKKNKNSYLPSKTQNLTVVFSSCIDRLNNIQITSILQIVLYAVFGYSIVSHSMQEQLFYFMENRLMCGLRSSEIYKCDTTSKYYIVVYIIICYRACLNIFFSHPYILRFRIQFLTKQTRPFSTPPPLPRPYIRAIIISQCVSH